MPRKSIGLSMVLEGIGQIHSLPKIQNFLETLTSMLSSLGQVKVLLLVVGQALVVLAKVFVRVSMPGKDTIFKVQLM